ncbi:MAG: 3-hydroxyacyl-CoA dehydrogenase [Pseudomonadota bacterium]|nr:3-hydroxyacyl-CoA dehydrogenase [Pseudomonadota bacterium]
MFSQVALIGAGFVGLGWAIVFSRSGFSVKVFDEDKNKRSTFTKKVESCLEDLEVNGLIKEVGNLINNIKVCSSLEETVMEASYVQESIFEDLKLKIELMNYLDKIVTPNIVIASSSSGITASDFSREAHYKNRFIVAHPVNPPYLIPLVEIVPSLWTSRDSIESTYNLMKEIGQKPIVLNKEIEGFILNRLQGVLLNEAWALYRDGYASLEDIDKTISEGLGMRWSFMGPFETIDLNAPGGISDYANRLGDLYFSVAKSRNNPLPWSQELIKKVETERRATLPKNKLPDKQRWRDNLLMKIKKFKLQYMKG